MLSVPERYTDEFGDGAETGHPAPSGFCFWSGGQRVWFYPGRGECHWVPCSAPSMSFCGWARTVRAATRERPPGWRTSARPVICGDAHVGNLGFYASPERDLVLDLNDFDEAHPAAGSGTYGGWPRASGSPDGRPAGRRTIARRPPSPVPRLTRSTCANRAYADQTEQDHQSMRRAVKQGRLPAETDT